MPYWAFWALLSALFAALVAIFGKIGIQNLDSTLATTVRSVIMAFFLLAVSLALGKFSLLSAIDAKAFSFIVFSGVAGAMSWLFYFLALKHGPASGVVAIDRLSVVFVFILAILFLSESFTWLRALGAVLLTAGAVLMSI